MSHRKNPIPTPVRGREGDRSFFNMLPSKVVYVHASSELRNPISVFLGL